MMANCPQDGHYPQAAGPAEPPASMATAVRLMYAGAGTAVVLGITAALTTHSPRRVVHIGNPASGGYKAGEIIGGVIVGLVAGGLWLWMAWANKRARSWARILSTVFFGVLTLYVAGSLASTLPTALKIVVIAEWVAGIAAVVFLWQRQSTRYYKAVNQPGGYTPVRWVPQHGQRRYAQQPYNPSSYGQPPLYGQPPQPPYGQPQYGQPGGGHPPHGQLSQHGQPPAQSPGQPPYRHPGQHLDQPPPRRPARRQSPR
jgi:hypothetical protein